MPKKKEREILSLYSLASQLETCASLVQENEPHLWPLMQAYIELVNALKAKLKLYEHIADQKMVLQGDLDLQEWIERAQTSHREADRLLDAIAANPAQLINARKTND